MASFAPVNQSMNFKATDSFSDCCTCDLRQQKESDERRQVSEGTSRPGGAQMTCVLLVCAV